MHNFTHLQVHSHYTLMGATASVKELAERAALDGMMHLALTDTNALYGVVAFDRACGELGVHPILGMTATVQASQEDLRDDAQTPGQIVLLATGGDGYRSLCRLSSIIQGSPERTSMAARGLSWQALKTHRKGLICLSGGRKGWIERFIRRGDLNAAHRYTGRLAGIYGDCAYLNLELHRPEDVDVAYEVVALSLRFGLPTVAVQPVLCLSPQDAPRLKLLTAIRHNCRIGAVSPAEEPGGVDEDVDVYWLSPDEVAIRYAAFPQAVATVGELAMRCGSALPDGRPIWPGFSLPQGQTAAEALAEDARVGLERRYGLNPPQETVERLESELTAISRHGFDPLFLVVADIARFAREAKITMSTRGSVANSLVAFCIRITSVDPIEHDLLFERFLNPARTDPPDIDLDFCSRRRDDVLEYVRNKYGSDRVAMVATISTMRRRSAVRETAKAYGLNTEEIKRLISALPTAWLSQRRRDDSIRLQEVVASLDDLHWRQIVRAAAAVEGQPRHVSIHPGGVVITPESLTDVVAVQWAPKGLLITQFDHQDLERLGLPKLDLLGIRALTVLADATQLVKDTCDPDFSLDDISLADHATGVLLSQAATVGVFQCESAGARRTLRQLRARTVRDLAVANALFKPGPATGGMAETFVRRYRGEEPVSHLHPALATILDPTNGVLIFQEQILRIARTIAGFSWAEANLLRRGVKFDPTAMAAVRGRFLSGCQRAEPDGPGFTPAQAETLWEQVVAFSGYGFNQGHATAYADVSYRSAYLKAHWPVAFLCARLADRGGFHHPAIYIAEAERLGVKVRPPHVNQSGFVFTLGHPCTSQDGAVLWMGLGAVRDLRRAAIKTILTERARQPFEDLRDVMRRVRLQPREIVHLIKCGALDGLGDSRAVLLAESEEIQRAGSALQMAFSFARPRVPRESQAQRVAWERRLLGQPVSVHPLAVVADSLPKHERLRSLADTAIRHVIVAGVRLPGWTGGPGFFLGDGDTYITVRGADPPPPWRPLLVQGQWILDEWGTAWLQAREITAVPMKDVAYARSDLDQA